MKWVTRERPKTDRIACPWLIKNFIDAEAEFLYVPTEQVLEAAEREGAHSYDAPNAEYTHRDGLCSFEVLLEEYELDEPALQLLARIVHGADVARRRPAAPGTPGRGCVASAPVPPPPRHPRRAAVRRRRDDGADPDRLARGEGARGGARQGLDTCLLHHAPPPPRVHCHCG